MTIQIRRFCSVVLTAGLVVTVVPVLGLPAQAQEDTAAPAEKPAPQTTSDTGIPADHLRLLVKPLTKEELVVEVDDCPRRGSTTPTPGHSPRRRAPRVSSGYPSPAPWSYRLVK
jgi:hypothetical protein